MSLPTNIPTGTSATDSLDTRSHSRSAIDPESILEGPGSEDEDIYVENILDHYRHPHHFGKLESCTLKHHELNPLCGDRLELFIALDATEKIVDASFLGKGCAISQASMSMLTDKMKGMSLQDLKAITKQDILEMLGIPVGIVRMKCALLSLKTLQKGIEQYETGELK